MKSIRFIFPTIAIITMLLFPFHALAMINTCRGSFLNPFSEIHWPLIFPVKIGGITLFPSSEDSADLAHDASTSPVCICPAPPPAMIRIGTPISYYEPKQIIETVKSPFCFPSLGTSSPLDFYKGKLSGDHMTEDHSDDGSGHTRAQAHFIIFPVWAMMDMFKDLVCKDELGQVADSLDIGYLSEVDPFWNEDKLSLLIRPETILFANPLAQLSCIADTVRVNVQRPTDTLFWCMGSWGATYPMTGVITNPDSIAGNAAIAARMLANVSRQGLVADGNVNVCSSAPTPIWIKSHYLMSISRPMMGKQAIPIGRSSLVWGNFKNPGVPGWLSNPDNFVWPLFSRQTCCVTAW